MNEEATFPELLEQIRHIVLDFGKRTEALKDFEKACKIGEVYDFVDVLKEDFSESVQKVKKSL